MKIETANLPARAAAIIELVARHADTLATAERARVTVDCRARVVFRIDTDPGYAVDVNVDPRCGRL